MRQFFGIVEIRTKIVSVSTLLLGNLYAILRTGSWDPLKGGLLIAAALLVDMGTTGFNTYFDYWNGVDDKRFNRESSKVVVHEDVPWGWALVISAGLFALAMPLGAALALLTGFRVILYGLFGMAVGFLYTGGPFPISRTPFGEFFAGGALGSLLFVLTHFVQAGFTDWQVVLASLPSSLAIAAILTVNNTCDIEGDRASGRRTLSILLGRAWGERIAVLLAAGAQLLLALLALAAYRRPAALLIPLPFFLASLMEFRGMHRRGYGHETKEAAMGGISKVFLLFTAAAAFLYLTAILTGPAGPAGPASLAGGPG